MRGILLTLLILGSLPFCAAKPWIGVIVWSWFGYMNPHRLVYDATFGLAFALLIGLATLAGIPFAQDRKPIPWVRETYVLATLWIIYTLSTLAALYPDEAWPQLGKVSKILLFTFVTMMFFQDRTRLRYLCLVIALSIGFYGFKGGIGAILSGGSIRVQGPEGSFLGSNNSIGLALNMTLPFLFYLAKDESRRWLRYLLWATFCLSILAVMCTYSRGAMIGLPLVLGMLFLKGHGPVRGLAVALAVALAFLLMSPYIPERWWERMGTIENYEEDSSAQGRLTAWRVAFSLALERPILGGGFWALAHPEIYARYGFKGGQSAHSIYFSVLGDHGFVALGFFVFLIVSCLWSLFRLRRAAPAGSWIVRPALMLEASLIAYMVSGAFLTEAYFDLFYHLVSFVIILRVLAPLEASATAPEAADREQPAAATFGRTRA